MIRSGPPLPWTHAGEWALEAPLADLAWCAADPHFERNDPALTVFFSWLEAFRASRTPRLILLGDLFQVWVGLPAVQTQEQSGVIAALGTLAAAGRTVVYLRGNRDYFIEEPLREAGLLLRDEWDMEAPSVGRVRFEHGDLINTSDQHYLRWREISRSGTVRALFQLLPPERQKAVARRLEQSLSGTNAYYKSYRPRKEMERWARRLAAEGVGAAVLGHFHVDEVSRAAGVDIRFVPQFREDGAFLRISANGTAKLDRFSAAPKL